MQYDTGSPIYKAVTSRPMSCDVNNRVKGVLVAAFQPHVPALSLAERHSGLHKAEGRSGGGGGGVGEKGGGGGSIHWQQCMT